MYYRKIFYFSAIAIATSVISPILSAHVLYSYHKQNEDNKHIVNNNMITQGKIASLADYINLTQLQTSQTDVVENGVLQTKIADSNAHSLQSDKKETLEKTVDNSNDNSEINSNDTSIVNLGYNGTLSNPNDVLAVVSQMYKKDLPKRVSNDLILEQVNSNGNIIEFNYQFLDLDKKKLNEKFNFVMNLYLREQTCAVDDKSDSSYNFLLLLTQGIHFKYNLYDKHHHLIKTFDQNISKCFSQLDE